MKVRRAFTGPVLVLVALLCAGSSEAGYVQDWVDAQGGCSLKTVRQLGRPVRYGEREFLGKPASAWTQADLAEFVAVYGACARKTSYYVTRTSRPTPQQVDAAIARTADRLKTLVIDPARAREKPDEVKLPAPRPPEARTGPAQQAPAPERAADAPRQAGNGAPETGGQLADQARRDREAAAEATRLAAIEEEKLAALRRDADAARREREAAERRLAEARRRLAEAQQELALAEAGQKEIGARKSSAPKTFGLAVDRFDVPFNAAASTLGVDARASRAGCQSGVRNACQYAVGSKTSILTSAKAGEPNASEIMVLHTPTDAVAADSTDALAAFLVVASTLSPRADQNARSALVLDLLKRVRDGAEQTADLDGVRYSLIRNAAGIFFVATPAP